MATKRTYQPKQKRKIRRMGFRAKMEKHTGRNIIKRRRAKGRKKLTVSDTITRDKKKRFTRSR
jgi:large subunit ribosomal protein L34